MIFTQLYLSYEYPTYTPTIHRVSQAPGLSWATANAIPLFSSFQTINALFLNTALGRRLNFAVSPKKGYYTVPGMGVNAKAFAAVNGGMSLSPSLSLPLAKSPWK